MDAATLLRQSRRRARLSQRTLAARAGVAQSTVARIESSASDPHVSMLALLLRACGQELEALPRLGIGVDRSQLRANLRLTPAQRLDRLAQTTRNAAGWRGIARRQATEAPRAAVASASLESDD